MTKHRWKEMRQEIEKADICITSAGGFETLKLFFVIWEKVEKLIVFERPPVTLTDSTAESRDDD